MKRMKRVVQLLLASVAAAGLTLPLAAQSQRQTRIYSGDQIQITRSTTRPTTRPTARPAARPTTRAARPAEPTFPIPFVSEMKGHTLDIKDVVFSHDGKRLATASEDRTVRLWDVETGKELHKFEGHTGSVLSLDFSPDDRFIVSGSVDAMAKVWDVQTREQIAEFASHPRRVNCVAYHPNGRWILTGSCDHALRVWDVESEGLVAKYPQGGCVKSIAVSTDGELVVAGLESGLVRVWNLKTQQLERDLVQEDQRWSNVVDVAITGDNSTVLSSSYHHGQVAWDLKTGRPLVTYARDGGAKLDVTPDGSLVVSGLGQADFFETRTGKHRSTLAGSFFFTNALGDGGKRVALATIRDIGRSYVVYVFDVATILEKLPPQEERE